MTDQDDLVQRSAARLRSYANHFARRDWAYTRRHDIKHIRYRGDWSGYDSIGQRLRRAASEFVRSDDLHRMLGGGRVPPGLRHPIIYTRIALRTPKHLPDGVLRGGGIITFWEEDGEYLQCVQPSVGSLLADLMDAHPDLPEVRAIATEMQRIDDDYFARLRADHKTTEETDA